MKVPQILQKLVGLLAVVALVFGLGASPASAAHLFKARSWLK